MVTSQARPRAITNDFISDVTARLAENKRVRRRLPVWGRLHIDRQLPFLVVYRRPPRRNDSGTERLIISQAAYLNASGQSAQQARLSELVQQVIQTQFATCGGFLLLELWATPHAPAEGSTPAFRIYTPKAGYPERTVDALQKNLGRIRIAGKAAQVSIEQHKNILPPRMKPLLTTNEQASLGCFVLGLEVSPIYRNAETGEVFPILRRTLLDQLTGVLQQAFFEFTHHQTNIRPIHYHALGRQAMVEAVWDADHQLAEIGNAFDFLLTVTPTNGQQAWNEFKRKKFSRAPTLHYRPQTSDPALLKRKLWEIPIENLEDPTIGQLFREKRDELDIQLTMLSNINTPRFMYGGLQLYGHLDDGLVQTAQAILKKIPPRNRDESAGQRLNAHQFAKAAEEELAYYRQQVPTLPATVEIRPDVVGLMVSRGNLLIGTDASIPANRVEALLSHEVGTHVLTYHNGRVQPLQQLYVGLADYDELQEGLAVLTEYLVGGLSRPRLRLLAARVIAAHCLTDGATFVDTFRQLRDTCRMAQRIAFTVTNRIYRGGGLIKDAIYLRGLIDMLNYLGKGGDIEPLFVGKLASQHIPIIHELQLRQVLKPPALRPRYMDKPETTKRLARLRKGVSVLELIERKK